jgi:hypothetical protein
VVALHPTEGTRIHSTLLAVTRDPPSTPSFRVDPAVPVDLTTERFALRASAGLAFLLIADGQGNGIQLLTFDPRCEAPH